MLSVLPPPCYMRRRAFRDGLFVPWPTPGSGLRSAARLTFDASQYENMMMIVVEGRERDEEV